MIPYNRQHGRRPQIVSMSSILIFKYWIFMPLGGSIVSHLHFFQLEYKSNHNRSTTMSDTLSSVVLPEGKSLN